MASTRQEKAIAAKLKQLQALPANKICADCGDKGNRVVRFASVKLGVFLCNQCYAAHRQLGAHITRGKVMGMDNFTHADVELLERVGNERANSQYEATLPAGAKPPPTPCNGCSGCCDCRQRLEYIRDKYERKKWYSDRPAATTQPLSSMCVSAAPAPATTQTKAATLAARPAESTSLTFFDALPTPAQSAPAPAPTPQSATTDDLLSFFAPSVASQAATAPTAVSSNGAFMTGASHVNQQQYSRMAQHQRGPQFSMLGQQSQQSHMALASQPAPSHMQQVRTFGNAQQQQQQQQQHQPTGSRAASAGPIDPSLFFK